ncbi:MAG: SAM-dependent methyltransferase [Chloroflexi bacterium]|nr:SAM-dependent methyltransferase [Chloroflexota bacterium]
MAQAPDLHSMSLESYPSISALNVARCRAIAAHETREGIQGRDHLAEVFLGEAGRNSLLNPAIYSVILEKVRAFSPGTYEYFIARTAYLDAVMEDALRANIPQIVLLGTGYDTRAYRFAELIQDTWIFELDMPPTLAHKRALLAECGVTIPAQVTFLGVDFARESLSDRLFDAGYVTDQETLFIWEGVTYFLPPKAVDDTLRFVRQNSPAGSAICFDYMIPETEMANRFGAQRAREAMRESYPAEPLQWDLDEGQVEAFLAERGFRLVEHLMPEMMQQRYLTLADGSSAGPILDLFRIVKAAVRD